MPWFGTGVIASAYGCAVLEAVGDGLARVAQTKVATGRRNGDRIEIFGHGGGRREAERQGIPFLGEVPIFTEIREGGDRGVPVVVSDPQSQPGRTFLAIAENLRRQIHSP